MACFKFLGPAVNELIYWNSKPDDTCEMKKKGRPRTLPPIEEFFLVLVRLILSRILRSDFGCPAIPLWSPKNVAQTPMPKCFRNLYPITQVIIK